MDKDSKEFSMTKSRKPHGNGGRGGRGGGRGGSRGGSRGGGRGGGGRGGLSSRGSSNPRPQGVTKKTTDHKPKPRPPKPAPAAAGSDDETESAPAQMVPKRPKRMPKTLKDYGVDFDNQTQLATEPEPFVSLIKQVFENNTRQLTGSTPGLRLVIVCASAERVLEVIKQMHSIKGIRVAKLFARHIKPAEQVDMIVSRTFAIGVGTPHRISKLLLEDGAQEALKSFQHLVFDQSHVDQKGRGVFDEAEDSINGMLALASKAKWSIYAV
ncbi:U3-containing 90S pre-ribosomal complex subunit-domain containing protein [Entophlyctis helioformis]|nr:U3-containing 90S pre-ribosomal complex subunit-domain containing protein [Entophlyctis helioformis]